MLYLPWLVIVLKQVSQVNGAYWIGDITIDTIKWYIQYILSVNNKSLSTLIEISYICVLVKLILDKNKYWIGDITIDTIKWYIQYILSVNNKSLSTLIEISYICVLVKLILDKNKTTEEKIYTFMGCLVPVLTILIGVVVSWLMRPIFVERYILPSLGCWMFLVMFCYWYE